MWTLRLIALFFGVILLIGTVAVGALKHSPIWIVYAGLGFTAVMLLAHPVGKKICFTLSENLYHGSLMMLVVVFQQFVAAAVCFYLGVGLSFIF